MRVLTCKKRTRLYNWALFVVISSLLLVPGSGLAEEEAYTIKSLYISLRPEYDQPSGWEDPEIPAVLVVNQLDVVNNTEEPITTFSFDAPIDADNFFVFATGKLREQGQYWPAPHVLSEGQIHINLQNQPILPDEDYTLVVQYYYNPFAIEGAKKSFHFDFAPAVTIPEVRFDVQLPPAGRNGKVEPAKYALSTITENNVNQENPISVDVSYEKSDNIPTNSPLKSKSTQSSETTDMKLVIFIVLLLGIVLAAFTVLRPKTSPSKQSNTKKRQQQKQPTERERQKVKATEQQVNATRVHVKKQSNEEQKQLRKQLLSGEIDEATYQEKMKKLN